MAPRAGKGLLCELANPKSCLVFHYNPPSYIYRKKVNYAAVEVPGANDPIIQFSCGGLKTIPLELLLNEWGEEFAGVSSTVLPESERGRVERDIDWLEKHSELAGPSIDDYRRLQLLFCWGSLPPVPVVISSLEIEREFHERDSLKCLRGYARLELSRLNLSAI
jgi:hypothetical protein